MSNVTIENRNGSVAVTVPEQSGFAYQVDANNGDIETDFSQIKIPEGGYQKKTVSGIVGEGGPLLRITTSQGDVSLKKASILPLPPTPPMPPKLTALPPGTREAIDDAKQSAKEAAAEARAAAKEAAAEAKKAAEEARQKAKDQDQ